MTMMILDAVKFPLSVHCLCFELVLVSPFAFGLWRWRLVVWEFAQAVVAFAKGHCQQRVRSLLELDYCPSFQVVPFFGLELRKKKQIIQIQILKLKKKQKKNKLTTSRPLFSFKTFHHPSLDDCTNSRTISVQFRFESFQFAVKFLCKSHNLKK